MSSKKIQPDASYSNYKNTSKRTNDGEVSVNKRSKCESNETENEEVERKKLFMACEQVSYFAYFNCHKRFELVYLPICININNCNHHDGNVEINSIPSHAEQSFNIEFKTNMWHDALEICFLSLTPSQYLPANVLKNITEIMLNVHEDPDADFTASHIIEKCQQILSQNFSTHPPCNMKTIRKCYSDFLISPMDIKNKTFTNRSRFGSEKGIVRYCMNRLEHEISLRSRDKPLIDKFQSIPDEIKQSVQGLHWQKEKCEIFEALDRNVRIKRLFAVLESVIELLQFDLAIVHVRNKYTTNSRSTRSQRPLMAFVLWENKIPSIAEVNNNCKQILKLFAYLVHLQYPEEYLRIITMWLNSVVQTFYLFWNQCNIDYPNIGSYCNTIARVLFSIIQDMPEESIYRIIKRIRPTFIQHLVGCMYIRPRLRAIKDDDIIQIVTNFIKQSQWKRLKKTEDCNEVLISTDNCWKEKKISNVSNYLSGIIKKHIKRGYFLNNSKELHPKFDERVIKFCSTRDQLYFTSTLYITLLSFLDAYNVKEIQDTLDTFNEQLLTVDHIKDDIPKNSSYTVTESFINKYSYIYKILKDLKCTLHMLKRNGKYPEILKIFENVSLLRQ